MSLPITEQSWNIAAWTMVYFLAGGTLFALAGAVVRLALRRAHPTIRYAMSVCLFVLLAAMPVGIAGWLLEAQPQERGVPIAQLPNPTMPMQTFNQKAAVPEPWIAESENVIELKDAVPPVVEGFAEIVPAQPSIEVRPPLVAQVGDAQQDAATMWVMNHLPWVWLAGSPLTFLFLSAGLVGTGRLRKRCEPVTTGPIVETALKLRQTLGVGRQVGVAICDSLVTPVLVGIVRPLILLPPAALTGWNASELEMVLVHELAHVRRWDNLVNLLQRIVESLLFFHPCVWWVSHWVRRDREECCDAVVVKYTDRPQAYAELLIALASQDRYPGVAASAALARHPLAGRIRRILKLEDEPMLVTRKTMWLVVCGTLGIVFSTPLLLSTDAEEPGNYRPNQSEIEQTAEPERKEADESTSTEAEIQFLRNQTVFPSPREAEIWKATQIALLKSQFVLANAYAALPDSLKKSNIFPASAHPVSWLSQKLVVEINGDNITLRLPGKPNQAAERVKILEVIRGIYEGEIARLKPSDNSPFPTLEEQKAADTAYRILGFELEKLTEEELARVKKLGYPGGLRLAFVKDSSYGGGYGGEMGRGETEPFSDGDILVGLHVWPTATIQQVNEILTREDLDQLIPLKYYKIVQVSERGQQAVRQGEAGGGRGGYGRGYGGRGGYGGEYGGGGGYGGEYGGRGERGGDYGDETFQGGEFGGEMGRGESYGEAPEEKMVDKLVTGRFTPNMQAWEAEVKRRHDAAMDQSNESKLHYSQQEDGTLVLGTETAIQQAEPKFVYDGKSFEEWKAAWRRDLSIDFRIQAVEAFVAFANAGVGKDPIDEILEIAGQYPWDSIGADLITPLQKRIEDVFAYPPQVPVEVAAPSILARAKDEKLQKFFPYVIELFAAKSKDKETYESLQKAFPNIEFRQSFEEIQEANRNLQELQNAGYGGFGGAGLGGGGSGGFGDGGFMGGAQQSAPAPNEKSDAEAESGEGSQQQQPLLYKGRTFDQWKNSWQRDISPDTRLAAVRALVAYANSGKGKEAVDVILQIAGEYRWDFWAGESSGDSVKQACASVFAGRQIPLDLVLTELATAQRSSNEQIKAFAEYVINYLANTSRETNEALRKQFPDAKIPTYEQLAISAALDQRRDTQARLNALRQSFAPDSYRWETNEALWETNEAGVLTYRGNSYEEWIKRGKASADAKNQSAVVNALAAFAFRELEHNAVNQILAFSAELGWDERGASAMGHPYLDYIEVFLVLPLDKSLEAVIAAKGSGNPFLPFAVVTLARRSAEANELLRKKFPEIEIPPYKQGPTSEGAGSASGERASNSAESESAHASVADDLAVAISPFNERPLSGSRATYQIFVENKSKSIQSNVRLKLRFPNEIVPDVNSLKSPVASILTGGDLRFEPVASLRPGERLTFTITTSVTGKGKAVITAEVTSKENPEGVETSTEVEIQE